MTDADLLRVKQLLERMFVGGLRFDHDGRLVNGTRWDYETSIFVGIELLATVGMSSVRCDSVSQGPDYKKILRLSYDVIIT